jgi:hypothetical protein
MITDDNPVIWWCGRAAGLQRIMFRGSLDPSATKGRAMKIKTTLCLIALTLAPTFALAGPGCDREKMQSASQCAPGQVWDAAQQACMPGVTS